MKKYKFLIIIFALMPFFILTYNLVLYKFFGPKYENVKREIWQQNKSYINGNIQILANYYRQYKEHPEDRKIIENIIRMEFANFDANTITNKELKNFLINVRGY